MEKQFSVKIHTFVGAFVFLLAYGGMLGAAFADTDKKTGKSKGAYGEPEALCCSLCGYPYDTYPYCWEYCDKSC